MTVGKATIGAIAFSGTTLILCFLGIASIYNEVQSIWTELDSDMDGFKLLTDDLWKDMVTLGAGTPANRKRRQSYGGYGASGTQVPSSGYGSAPTGGYGSAPSGPGFHPGPNAVGSPPQFTPQGPGGSSSACPNSGAGCCKCEAENKCPSGPQGPLGFQGPDGLTGLDGKDGIPGIDAENIHSESPKGCFHCPTGPTGPAGPSGRPGIRGMRGPKGIPGTPGSDGFPGGPGDMGPPGPNGSDGKQGTTGEKGTDAEQPVPRKGSRGFPGTIGEGGSEGDHGKDGPVGAPGPGGEPGSQGMQGASGPDGDEGCQGNAGKIGADANYCPCPKRGKNRGVNSGVQGFGSHGGVTPYGFSL